MKAMEGYHDFNYWTKIEDDKGSKEEVCALGSTSSQVCWLCISLASNPCSLLGPIGQTQRSLGHVLPPLPDPWCGLWSASHPLGPSPLSEMEVQRRVLHPLSETSTFIPALAQHSQDSEGTRSVTHQKDVGAPSWATSWISDLLFP